MKKKERLKNKTLSKADLHLHSNYSDGFNSVEEIINKAVNKNLSVIAIII